MFGTIYGLEHMVMPYVPLYPLCPKHIMLVYGTPSLSATSHTMNALLTEDSLVQNSSFGC